MPGGPPPPRWRVIERGRRLVVIDTRSGEALTPVGGGFPPRAPKEAPSPVRPERVEARPTLANGGRPPTGSGRTDQGSGVGLQTTSFDGRATLATARWYDDKAPRRLVLDSVAAATLRWLRIAVPVAGIALVAATLAAPWLIVVPLALVNDRTRAALRRRATRWLDRFDQASSAG